MSYKYNNYSMRAQNVQFVFDLICIYFSLLLKYLIIFLYQRIKMLYIF